MDHYESVYQKKSIEQASSEKMPGKISRLISRRDGVRDTHFSSCPCGIQKGATSLPYPAMRDRDAGLPRLRRGARGEALEADRCGKITAPFRKKCVTRLLCQSILLQLSSKNLSYTLAHFGCE